MWVVVSAPSARWYFCNIPAITTHNNNLSPTCSVARSAIYVTLYQTYREIWQRRSARWPSVSSVYRTAPVNMSHDRYGSYWKLTTVWGAVGKCKCGIVKLMCRGMTWLSSGQYIWLV
jgi:hypothetical protein